MNTYKRQTFTQFGGFPSTKNGYSSPMNFAAISGLSKPSSAPNIDLHDKYMARTHKTEKKLTDFFGDNDVPFDITINEIEASGLKAMLQSKVPLCYFLYSLLEDYCSENLFFFLEALEFENDEGMRREEQQENAIYIYNAYLSKKSCIEINIDEKIYKEVNNFIKNINVNTSSSSISKCYKGARNSVYQLMEGSYAKFIKSNTYKTMKKELGHRIYNDNDKLNAVSKLRDYIVKRNESLKQSLKQNPNSQIALLNVQQHEIISLLVHEFTKSILGIDFNEKDIFFTNEINK